MARPFPNTFNKDSPMSPQSAVSYQTNVNRQKTKKWTEAKAVDYGGDDWGDDDDYDLPPPPISKPTGLRQQGQGVGTPSKVGSPIVDNGRKYGDLPPLPGASTSRPRANSFDADDEKRNFSNSSTQPPLAFNAPATRFSQSTGAVAPRNASGPPLSIATQQPVQPPVALQQTNQISPVLESPHPNVLTPGPERANTGESPLVSPVSELRTPSSTGDFHARRDFSPSALPPPLSTRASPAPQSATDTTPSQRFPARKSSLSQVSGPPLDEIMSAGSQDTTPKPWIGARSASPGTGTKSSVSPPKALPFIRPADIYRRAEEERRQSIESGGRPSLDSLMGARGGPDTSAARRRASFETDDGSDSGRRLAPILEPVKERKSEYGFEGFNVNDHGPQQNQSENQAKSQNDRNLDVEDVRRHSTSPKLPDLGRMSGFGMDMFSSEDVAAISKEPETTPTTATLSSPDQNLKLRNQPSFGFKSVVNQAFDTTDDHSLPDTPASRSASGVNRTDSESTGTGGISPIMSRVSSTAIPETRDRDKSTPAIMEAMEPDSPERSGNDGHGHTFDGPQAPGFKPGHRRDISAPSPGNSPARTPDLATSHHMPGSQHAVVDESSDVTTPTTEEPLHAPRPFAEREKSFRPSLPGGWTSYATTAQNELPTPGVIATPVNERAPHDDDDYDTTSTTTKRSLPQSSLGASLTGAAPGSAAHGRHDHASPSGNPATEPPRAVFGGSPLISPESAASPTGHMHPSRALDASYPPLENAPAETQLRPVVVNRAVSSQATPPSPPPKDTPTNDQSGSTSGYFPTIPVAKTPQNLESRDRSQSPARPQIIPTLSTDSEDYDEENDKLRKEIVKSLRTTPSNATAHTSDAASDRVNTSNPVNANRESSYLPSEYDNYWATTDQDGAVPPIAEVHRDVSEIRPLTASTAKSGTDSPVPAPLSPRRPEESLQPSRPGLQSRFSWEQSSNDVTAGVSRDQGYLATNTSASISTANELPGSVVPVEEEKEVAPRSRPGTAGSLSAEHGARDAAFVAGGAALVGGAGAITYADRPEEKSRRMSLAEEKDPRVTSHPVSPTPPEDEHPSRSPQQNFPTSPDAYQHPPAPPSTVSPVASSVRPFVPPQATGRLVAFREIVALKSPQERIKTFDETRHRFAIMDSGLDDWIIKLQTQFPDEHGSATSSWGNSRASMPASSIRGKFSKAPGAGGPAPPLQQPYYQQYLNASSPTSPSTPVGGTPSSRPGSGMPSGSQQGLGGTAGSKITSQQVQAKGKELLHTAGIFGGKAGKAGKGLLAKGKNKLRAAGGGDKTSPYSATSPVGTPKSKPDRRSSWGLPLSLTRSSTRPDAFPRNSNSRESTPTNRSRTNTMPTERTSPAPVLPAVGTGSDVGRVINGALASEQAKQPNTSQRVQPQTPNRSLPTEGPRISPVRISNSPPIPDTALQASNSKSEARNTERDSLVVPAPISKSAPSWDPFNATPIAEEDDFSYGERPKARASTSDPKSNPDGLNVPRLSDVAKSDRSNSTDAPFFDASEEADDVGNDWVMVGPEPTNHLDGDALTSYSGADTEPTTRQNFDRPTTSTSILNRPRGSFSQDILPQTPVKSEARRSIDAGQTSTTSILNRPRGSFSYATPPPISSSQSKHIASPLTSPPEFKPVQKEQPVQQAIQSPAPMVTAPVPAPAQRDPLPQKAQAPEKSSFLPPIRRTSTFGIGFGKRAPKQRFPIEDDGEISPPRVPSGPYQQEQQDYVDEASRTTPQLAHDANSNHAGAVIGATVGAAVVAGIASGLRGDGNINEEESYQVAKARKQTLVDSQRPLSFVQTSNPGRSSQELRGFSAGNEAGKEDFGPKVDIGTLGTKDVRPAAASSAATHGNFSQDHESARRDSSLARGENQRPLSFIQTSNPGRASQELRGFSDARESSSPADDTNTWGVRDEQPPQNMAHPPLPISSGRGRQPSFPPPGFVTDPAPLEAVAGLQRTTSGSGKTKEKSFLPPDFASDPASFRDTVSPSLSQSDGKQRQSSFPPPGFVPDDKPFNNAVHPVQVGEEEVFDEEPEEYDQRDDTDTWGVRDEIPRNMVHPPLPGVAGKQRRISLTRPGFAADPEDGSAPDIQPLDSRSEGLKQLLTVDTGSSAQQSQSSIPPQVFQVDNQAHGPTAAARSMDSIDPPPRSPAHDRSSSREPTTRPLSFQKTPPRENGHQRKSSLPLSFTRGPEMLNQRAGNADDDESSLGSDPRRSQSMARRDPEKDDFDYPQRPLQQAPQVPSSKVMFPPPQANNILQNPEAQKSQVEWRPNRPKAASKPVQQPSYNSESYNKEMGPPAVRTDSWDAQPPPRGYSGSSPFMQRQDSQFSEKGGWASPQPPSSAQRYPELFKPGQSQSKVGVDAGSQQREADLPAQYYQAPISRAQAFLPRQQTNEYQLPGVGPPEEFVPANPSRRNSSFLRNLSRTSSRERRTSLSRDQDRDRMSPERGLESRGEYAESTVISEDGLEQKKKRASFFGSLTTSRNSYSGQSPPKSRESVIAHHASSRIDLAGTPPLANPAKRSFFSGTASTAGREGKPKKLVRQSTTGSMMDGMGQDKKKEKGNRFSMRGSFFGGKSSPAVSKTQLQTTVEAQQQQQREPYPYSQAMRDGSVDQRQPIYSSQSEQQQAPITPNKYSTPDKAQARAESQSRREALSKLSASVAPPAAKMKEERRRSKSRRPSAAGLLNSFLGKKSTHKDGLSTPDSRSQGTAGSSQPQVWPQPLLSQTYTDLQDPPLLAQNQNQRQESPFQQEQQEQREIHNQMQAQRREIPFHDPSLIDEGRGRTVSREPQYDSVPIPGGYSLVRGEGATVVQSEYDPRNLNQGRASMQEQRIAQQQLDPRDSQTRNPSRTRMDRIRSQQSDPRYAQTSSPSQSRMQDLRMSFPSQNNTVLNRGSSPVLQQQQQQPPSYVEEHYRQQQQVQRDIEHPQPQVGKLEAYGGYENGRGMSRISHEDILARSPPKPLLDQQRPYQLSLPGGGIPDDDEDENGTLEQMANANLASQNQIQNQVQGPTSNHHSKSRASRGQSSQDPIIRLQQPPTLRHPESPAGYPLPEDTVFSPVNPKAMDIPPPPLPKDDHHQQRFNQQDQRVSYDDEDIYGDDADLNRSNTRRTAVSAVSGVTASRQGSTGSQNLNGAQNSGGTLGGGLNPHISRGLTPSLTVGTGAERAAGREAGRRPSPSPTPPSPMEGDGADGGIRRTVVNRASVDDLDLYNASPRLPRDLTQQQYPSHAYQDSNGRTNSQKQYSHGGQAYQQEREGERQHRYPEEKIYYNGARGAGVGQENGPAELEDHETSMSATSYPGQEWNPYAMGTWDDGVDDVGVGSSYR